MLSKFSFATKAGTSSHLRTKANQDVYLMKTNLLELEHCHLFAVCDGHGNNGRQIATLVQKQLQVYLEQEMLNHFEGDLDYDYPSRKGIENTFNTVFQRIEEELTKMAEDIRYSGCTCTIILLFGQKMYVANLGDSRSILVRQGTNSCLPLEEDYTVKQLTKDHNLKDPEERRRILDKGGRIDPFRDRHGNPLGPERIWLQTQAQPGLVMTRSFGDHLAHSVGCSPYPELFAFKIGSKDRMLVVASDGVWEFLSNADVASIVYPFFL